MIIVLKNISGAICPIDDMGISLAISETRQVFTSEVDFEFSLDIIVKSKDLHLAVVNDKIILNNGTSDLTKQQSLDVLTGVSKEDIITSGGITQPVHDALNVFVHNVGSSNYKEVIRTGSLITSIIIWKDSNKLIKIREYSFTRTNNLITQCTEKIYTEGVLSQTSTYNITRVNNLITNIVETIA